jgi:predicted O-linked N-acetylglucosamine transferase (SPINDLY family)
MNAITPPEWQADAAWLQACMQAPEPLASIAAAHHERFARALLRLNLAQLLQLSEDAAGHVQSPAQLLRAWLALYGQQPEAFGVWFNLGVELLRHGQPGEAATAYGNALALKPDLHAARVNLGLALEASGDRAGAQACWRQAMPAADTRRVLHNHLGRSLEDQGLLPEAEAELRASLLITPDQPDVLQHWTHIRQRMTDWPILRSMLPGLSEAQMALHTGPLAALALFDDPARQREVAAAWIARKLPPVHERLAPAQGYAHPRIRIGYLSSDFCRHAMSFLIAELLERHDRTSFEVFGYCASPDDGSDVRSRVIAALDHHVPVRHLDDEAVARRIRADEIDILVELNGLTRGSRLGALRWKPAPVQATYLGYIGPVPLPELDWLISDAIAIPPEEAPHYMPRPLHIEGCYQANDSRAPVLPAVSRAAEGLPEDAFVFCCFSHHYKITESMFSAWLDIMAQSPRAVLWLIDDGPASRAMLSARWAALGLAPERLIFAQRVDPARYRARMALADLFLDTSPYNAGTIASDALRMGLPLLTLSGRAFAARMATSLLSAMQLPDCIARDMADYTDRAIAIAANPAWHEALRMRCGEAPWMRSLGDSAGFTRRLEDAYRRIRLRP